MGVEPNAFLSPPPRGALRHPCTQGYYWPVCRWGESREESYWPKATQWAALKDNWAWGWLGSEWVVLQLHKWSLASREGTSLFQSRAPVELLGLLKSLAVLWLLQTAGQEATLADRLSEDGLRSVMILPESNNENQCLLSNYCTVLCLQCSGKANRQPCPGGVYYCCPPLTEALHSL